jgi:hypothetical protein
VTCAAEDGTVTSEATFRAWFPPTSVGALDGGVDQWSPFWPRMVPITARPMLRASSQKPISNVSPPGNRIALAEAGGLEQ